ncbi:30S ribosomal protein S6 [Finegoldia magna]|uniref:30S ribosomal protein S6 n=1 Tax=Finegoldia magna TaxID=1260 RepID=UPI000B91C6D5|nr:30S ribosomal protein S6 [Finegoldia magna]MCC3310738.1 30S ribosomal protein S6 [Finegoldia magna]MDU5199903.1 30S ribosomal protein S6 [Finegoldia magna]MDU6774870.1 30S ribosomal protein S6 [Finegoldia magna]OXZ32902.1 30S ribosomal protein S6 [Finegoldia magna]PWV53207.1 SSU ribosomal protein S6P [Finegoldia magna]
MNKYELVLIFKPELSEEDRNTVFSRIQQVIDENGKLEEVHDWGKRKLAYEINYIKEGYYYIVNFDLYPQFVKEIERRCRLFDQIIRYMVVRVDEQ